MTDELPVPKDSPATMRRQNSLVAHTKGTRPMMNTMESSAVMPRGSNVSLPACAWTSVCVHQHPDAETRNALTHSPAASSHAVREHTRRDIQGVAA